MGLEDRLARAEAEIDRLRTEVASLSEGRFRKVTVDEGLFLVDDDGSLRAVLASMEAGVGMALFGRSGSSLMLDGEKPSVTLCDSSGQIRAKFILVEGSEPTVMLMSRAGEIVLSLSVLDDIARVLLSDANETLRIALSAERRPHVRIYDADGNIQAEMAGD